MAIFHNPYFLLLFIYCTQQKLSIPLWKILLAIFAIAWKGKKIWINARLSSTTMSLFHPFKIYLDSFLWNWGLCVKRRLKVGFRIYFSRKSLNGTKTTDGFYIAHTVQGTWIYIRATYKTVFLPLSLKCREINIDMLSDYYIGIV